MLVPKLRFKREDGTDYREWEEKTLQDVSSYITTTGTGEKSVYVGTENMRKNCSGVVLEDNNDTTVKGIQYTLNDVLVSNIRPYLKKAWRADRSGICSTDVLCIRGTSGILSEYLYTLLSSDSFFEYVMQGVKGTKMPRGDKKHIMDMPVSIPCLEEQQKIADFLSTVDEVIAQSEAEVQSLEQQKKAAMQKIFSQEVRFKRENGSDYPEWEEKVFTDLFKSIPNKDYQVQTKEYKPNGKYRIIDQSQSFIAGYSDLESKVCYQNPCIIFGDHTTILKYVDFPFIVGADGVKTLIANDCYVAKYCFYLLGFNNVKPTGYNRHYSKLKELTLLCSTDIEEQQKIADFLSAYDEAISYAKQELDKWKELKKGLLQQMFV